MKQIIQYTCAAFAAGSIIVGLALASEKSGQKPDPKMEEMMKKAEAAGKPGAAHKALDPLAGDWTCEVKMWMDPSQPPTTSKGSAKAAWDFDGRFLREEFKGEFMGKPFRGLSFIGYDNVKQKYNSVWLDDMSTTIYTAEGDADSSGRNLSFGGTYSCALTGEKEKASRHVIRILSKDKHVFEMYDPGKGAEAKTMEITYTRK